MTHDNARATIVSLLMTNQDQPDSPPESSRRLGPKRIALRPITIILFLTVNLVVLMLLVLPYLQIRYNLPIDVPWGLPSSLLTSATQERFGLVEVESPTPTNTRTMGIPKITSTQADTLPEMTVAPGVWKQGLIVLSIQDGLDTHLFAYQPLAEIDGSTLPLTRITTGSWDDITPALNPDREHLIFTSNRNGQWDLYLFNLEDGDTTRVTRTSEYDATPSWSPDGLWVAYECYVQESLEILISPLDGSQEPVQLSNSPSADFSPAWSPQGRQIAFVSTRGGGNQIWIANLDESGEERFIKLSQHYEAEAAHPAWSPDGRYLAWAAVTIEGLHNLYVWDSTKPDHFPREIGGGEWPAWSPDGKALLSILGTPSQSYLTAYSLDMPGSVILPPVLLPGPVSGLVWADVEISGSINEVDYPTPTPLWAIDVNTNTDIIEGRWDLIPLEDVEAPYPRLHDRVDESFQALRSKMASEVGWDLFASLDNAFIPISSALSPGLDEDWLYTGRAITFNTLPINAGWMAVVREDYGQLTYWRVYLRARFQDGSQGRPLDHLPWDFNARYNGQPRPYDGGGEMMAAVPDGYWVDLTQLAAVYDWERLPALATWRAVYANARFNEFVKMDGLDWFTAMIEIYPHEVLLTLTPVSTATVSPSPAPFWFQSPTPTPTVPFTHTPTPSESSTATQTATSTPTPPPTLTQTMTGTATPTPSPSPTLTPTPTP